MAAPVPPSPPVVDGTKDDRSAWHHKPDQRFVWVAPSPSPAEVLELERFFPDVVQAPIESLEEEASAWVRSAIIARSLHRWVPPEATIREFRRAGITGVIEAVSLAHKCFFFRFSDPAGRKMTLERPWTVNGQPIATEEWYPEFVPTEVSVPSALLWVRLPNLPIEFWVDEILRSIITPAGSFVCSDPSTKLKNRGGFARVCVRVDLRRPFRPGVRVRGSSAPFWQPFQYEQLEGLCSQCGSLHQAGSCGHVPEAGVSSEGFIFGPWMTALRQRSPAHSSAPVARRRVSGDRIPGAASLIPGDGWSVPAKVARRRSTVTSSASAQGLAPSQRTPAGGSALVSSLDGSVPGSKNCLELSGNGTVSELGSQAVPESSGVQHIVQSKSCSMNPFSVLGTDEGAGRLHVSKDVNPDSANPFAIVNFDQGSVCPKNSKESMPGTAKRARPVEPLSQRVVSRSAKSKGKAPLAAIGTGHQSFSFSASADLARGHVALSGSGTKKSRCKVGHARGSGSDSTQSDLVVGLAHESAVLQLKQAIQGVESVEGMDSSQVAECCAMEPEMVIHPTDAEMIGEEMGVIPSQASE